MNKRNFFATLLLLLTTLTAFAQRQMENLGRGLVAVKTGSGVYCSWRILGNEYYDVAYNIYRDGTKLNATPLLVSNYTDPAGTTSSTYTVTAVVRGKEQAPSAAVKPWANDYLVIPKAKRISNNGTTDITNNYEPNDATFGDVDGDGEMEVFVKEICTSDQVTTSDIDFDRIEVYKLDGTLLWWIDCGPNLWDFQHNETNIAVYDWDQDGRAEAVMRAADGTIIHMADGSTYTVGDKTKNYRAGVYNFINQGDEFLLYMDGQTGKPYYCGQYPLKRLEDGETNTESAWGDGYGHRASKHFFGAPYLDGVHPSLFLARGIYTRHKMIAYDIDPKTHQLKERWRWFNSTPGAWYGQGYHNYTVADVDLDGRDEICFGSMVIDDDGFGLSTTGLGHGDAQHWGDLDPYKHGLEVFACNETSPANNYRDATTSKIYYRKAGGSDDGRCMAGNFTNDVPGAIGGSAHDTYISCVKADHVDGISGTGVDMNFRIYWDGDLLDETFNYVNGKNTEGCIHKYGSWTPIKTFASTLTNNDTKGTPCFQGDIFGDWREEVALRDADNNIRIEFSTIPTTHRIYTLLHDPQYRNAMVWQMNGYNQPPHVSWFMGELEGITYAPPAPMANGKTTIAAGGTISTATNDEAVLLSETGDATYTVANGAAPYILYDNAPSWVKGHGNNNRIEYLYYTHTLTGAPFTGSMRLVKQGDGTLTLPKVTQTYTGATELWAGTLNFDGTLQNSHVWMNRFAELNSDGGSFPRGIEMLYGSVLRPGGKAHVGTLSVDTLKMGFGSRIVFDINDSTKTSDKLTVKALSLEKKDWANGPQYSTPVFEIHPTYLAGKTHLEAGTYELVDAGTITGDVSGIVVDGINNQKAELSVSDGKIYITIADQRDAASVVWQGAVDGNWDLLSTQNFTVGGIQDMFVTGDAVTFNDDALNTTINIAEPVSPASLLFDNDTVTYTLGGDSIIGPASLIKRGGGRVNLNNVNRFTGNTAIEGGQLWVSSLANSQGQDYGSLGGISNRIDLSNDAVLGITSTSINGQTIRLNGSDGEVSVAGNATLTMQTGFSSVNGRHCLTKSGAGTLTLGGTNNLLTLNVSRGTLNLIEGSNADTLHLSGNGVKVYDANNQSSNYTNPIHIIVDEGMAGNFWMDPRCDYTGKLLGSGSLYVYAAGVRNFLKGDWSQFEGTVYAGQEKRGSYDPQFVIDNDYGLPKATLSVNSGTTVNTNYDVRGTVRAHSFSIGHVEGSGAIYGTGTLTIGALNKDMSEKTTLQIKSANVRKVGSGYWGLNKNNAQTEIGAVTIAGGELRLLDTGNATPLLNGSVTVTDSGRVDGRGQLKSITVNGGTLAPGNYFGYHYGSISTTGSVSLTKGRAEFTISNARNGATSRSYLEVGTSLALNDSVVIMLSPRYQPAVGDSIVLWTAKSFRGTPKLSLPELPEGMMWDTSSLFQPTGVLKIAASTGLFGVKSEESGARSTNIYTVGGVRVGSDLKRLPAGVYVVRENGRTYKINKK